MAATATRRMALAAVGAPLSAAPAAASASAAAAAAAVRGASTLASARVLLSAARPTASKPTPGGPISNFLGAQSEWTSDLGLVEPGKPMACFRVMDERAEFRKPDYVVKHDDDTLKRMYRTMVQLNEMDKILYDAQRQGRISFYMTSYGEEATHIGSASALEADDVIFGQYREAGVLMWRGFTLDEFAHQCFSSGHDVGKGRQMPVHYGSRRLNFQTISSPLGTQLPQAAGAAYALKRAGRKNIVMCYFGEGAASEGDFHVALNMAGTLSCPVVFFCRNNGYAISTPVREQYKGDGIAARGIAYGLPTIRVDGNDLLAVHDATALARERALKDNTPVVIEAMTYRGGHHSTSDDSTRYRGAEEIQYWSVALLRNNCLLCRVLRPAHTGSCE
jgi:2-oxoisovalerate dehydrogenase E1 component alpha subunit